MTEIKVIKTEEDYKNALKLIEELIDKNPDPESKDGEKLSLLSTLVTDYETRNFPSSLPSPVEAIKFRMDQADLKPADLIPYIGSRSRVSEILSGKRTLTLDMVRALESGLGIPAKVLIQKSEQGAESEYQHWNTDLIKAMATRGYFGNVSLKKQNKTELLKNFFSSLGTQAQPAMMFRKTNFRSAPRTDKHALFAWMTRVLEVARKTDIAVKYKPGTIGLSFMQELLKLSTHEDGPLLAKDRLEEQGIKVVIEPHLPKTHLDGAVVLNEKDHPVIGLTLRHDRLDNFWFTLMHELAHVALHYNQDIDFFYDEKLQDQKTTNIDPKEQEADELAEESILPKEKWEISAAKVTPSPMAAESLAKELGINIAVVAGVMRFKHQNYYYLNKIVNNENNRVQKIFGSKFK